MTKNPLPPEDLPPNPGLVETDDFEAARTDAGEMTPENPVAVGIAFLNAVNADDGPQVSTLRGLVTPESLAHWGDFKSTREMLSNCGMTTRADRSDLDESVAYVKYVTDRGAHYVAKAEMLIMARAVGTVVYRPELGGWRMHAVGDYLAP